MSPRTTPRIVASLVCTAAASLSLTVLGAAQANAAGFEPISPSAALQVGVPIAVSKPPALSESPHTVQLASFPTSSCDLAQQSTAAMWPSQTFSASGESYTPTAGLAGKYLMMAWVDSSGWAFGSCLGPVAAAPFEPISTSATLKVGTPVSVSKPPNAKAGTDIYVIAYPTAMCNSGPTNALLFKSADAFTDPESLTPAALAKDKYLKVSWSEQSTVGADSHGSCLGPVAASDFPTSLIAGYTGTVKVGQTLTATDPTGFPDGTTFTYSWKMYTNEVGTSKTYTIPEGSQGNPLGLTITATKGSESVSGDVSPGPIQPADNPPAKGTKKVKGVKAVFTGKPIAGQTLTVKPFTTKPANTHLTFCWVIDKGDDCAATSPSLTLTHDMVGKKVALKVTVTADGHKTVVKSSKAKKVKGPKLSG